MHCSVTDDMTQSMSRSFGICRLSLTTVKDRNSGIVEQTGFFLLIMTNHQRWIDRCPGLTLPDFQGTLSFWL